MLFVPRAARLSGIRTLYSTSTSCASHASTPAPPRAPSLGEPSTELPTSSSTPPPEDANRPKPKAHPYSLAEFTSPLNAPTEGWDQRHWVLSSLIGTLRIRRVSHSWYYRDLVQRVEVAEMQERLRKVHLDLFHRKFWPTESHAPVAIPPGQQGQEARPLLPSHPAHHAQLTALSPTLVPTQERPETNSAPSEQEDAATPTALDATPESAPPLPSKQPLGLSKALYNASVADTPKQRTYNRALLKELSSVILPVWEYQWLRMWVRVVGRVERILGWGF